MRASVGEFGLGSVEGLVDQLCRIDNADASRDRNLMRCSWSGSCTVAARSKWPPIISRKMVERSVLSPSLMGTPHNRIVSALVPPRMNATVFVSVAEGDSRPYRDAAPDRG